jgi:hypothetical protein
MENAGVLYPRIAVTFILASAITEVNKIALNARVQCSW